MFLLLSSCQIASVLITNFISEQIYCTFPFQITFALDKEYFFTLLGQKCYEYILIYLHFHLNQPDTNFIKTVGLNQTKIPKAMADIVDNIPEALKLENKSLSLIEINGKG